jgi:ABC-2 type transport system ATP-binding protein
MRMVVEGPAEQIQETLARVTGVNHVGHMPPIDGRVEFTVETTPGHDSRKELARAVVESGWGLLELRPAGMSLEDIFLKLTTKEESADSSGDELSAPEAPAPAASEETQA